MTQNYQHSPATEVWRRFAGMFGRDAVARKFGETIPDEWHAMLSKLNEYQVQRGIRMLAYSGKAHVPSLPEFVKLCRDAEHDREITDQPALPNPDRWQGDEWLAAANRHLLGYITRVVSADPKIFGRGPSYMAMKDPKRMHDKILDASPEHVRNVNTLVKFKNLWAEQMRLSANADGVPIAEQQEVWRECMKRAEAEIAKDSLEQRLALAP